MVLKAPTVSGFAVRCAIRALTKRHVEALPLLNRAALSSYDLGDLSVRIPASNQGKFLQYAADALNDPAFGLHLAEASNPRESGLLYYITSAAKDLWGTLELFLSFSGLVNESLRLKVSRLPDSAVVGFSFEGVSEQSVRHNTEFLVAMIVKTARQISGRHFRPLRVAFSHTSWGDAGGYEKFFDCPVEFGAPAGEIEISGETLSLSVLTEDQHLLQILKPVCEEAAKARGSAVGSLRASVEMEIQRRLPRAGAQSHAIAKALAMSERTLQRRLSAEGTSFGEIVDGVRRSLAVQYVGQPDITLAQAAWLLGYEAPASFSHAFRRWAGKSPSAARKEKLHLASFAVAADRATSPPIEVEEGSATIEWRNSPEWADVGRRRGE